MDVRVGLLRKAHGVELRQLRNARADGGRVVDPQGRAVLLGELGEGVVGDGFHGWWSLNVLVATVVVSDYARGANPTYDADHDAGF